MDTLKIADALGTKPPVSAEDMVRYMMGQPLDFDPGLCYAYSNLGYLLLGRVIETATGRNYEEYVKKEVLEDPSVYPPQEVKVKLVPDLADTEETTRLMTRGWQKFTTGK